MSVDFSVEGQDTAFGTEEDSSVRLSEEPDLQDPLVDPLSGGDAVQMSKFDTGPAESKTARVVESADVENPRHVVDRAETDKTGFR